MREKASVAVRAVRGATRLAADDLGEMTEAVEELVRAVLDRNGLSTDDLVSVLFTATPDLVCGFPAAAARGVQGLGSVPLICAQEIAVPGALSRVVRMMATVQTDLEREQIQHVYLRGAEVLRVDLAQ